MPKKFHHIFSLLAAGILILSFSGLKAQSNWLQSAGGVTPDEGLSISLDNSNNSYVTGYFSSTATFGTLGSMTASGVSDVFVAKLNSSGVYQWAAHGGGGANATKGLCIKADANGNTYVTGYFSGTATFGSQNITSAGQQDIFIAKYSPGGALRWVVRAGGTQSDDGNGITVDNQGDVYVTGQFGGTASFGPFNLTATGSNINVFIARVDSANGTFIWARSGVGPHTDRGLGVTADQAGNAYVTGQFTDTITFSLPHYTNLSNSIFIIKYNRTGNEKWFTTAGGGSLNIANAIASDASSNVYIAGNFTGTLTFYANNGNSNLTNTYSNRIFVARYDSNANLSWSVSDGSSNGLTCNSIAVDNSGNPYVIGSFECVLNGDADRYGQGTFNTVGYWDIFVSGYNNTGAWQWSRQIGGHLNNYGNGIASSSTGNVYTTGSFDQDVIVTTGANFIGYTSHTFSCNSAYCSDSHYGNFSYIKTAGNLDVFIAEPIDLTRQTYDYYTRTGSGCNRPYEGVCATDADTFNYCPDTITFCQSGELEANPYSCSPALPSLGAGPTYNYVWSNGQTTSAINVASQGTYTVTQTSVDGCFRSTGTVYVKIRPKPPLPNISDNVVINTNSTNPQNIKVCRDSVKLTGGGYNGYSYSWSEPGTATATTPSIWATTSGDYCFMITDSHGCTNQTCVKVRLDSAIGPADLRLKCITCQHHDTVNLCKGSEFDMFPWDSLTNPTTNIILSIPPPATTKVYWNVTPPNISYQSTTNYLTHDNNYMLPNDSGWYQISARIVRKNTCDSIRDTINDSVYVHFLPQPPPITLTISGKKKLCPGDSTWLVAHGAPIYSWSIGSTMDSIRVGVGNYTVNSSVTNVYGCSSSGSATAIVSYVVQPGLATNPPSGVICPGDSVRISCSGSGNFSWQGPTGPVGGNDSVIYVKTIGSYYCIESDTNGCLLLSNTILIEQYTTPSLSASPNGYICQGDSAKIVVQTTNGSTVQWLSPLSGSDSVKYVKTSGTYQCKITACGITTIVSTTVNFSVPLAKITASGPTTFCLGDSIALNANAGMVSYSWSPGNSTSLSINVKTTGKYVLTTTDTLGCKAKDSITINTSNPNGQISPGETVCFGTPVTLSASGGTSYKWSNGATTSTINVEPDTTTLYKVAVYNSLGCVDSLRALITVKQAAALHACCDETINSGDTAILHATGNPQNNYKWSPDSGLYCTSCPDPIADPTVTTTYTVVRLDSNGCVEKQSVTVTVDHPCIDFIVPNVFTPNNDGINDDFVVKVENIDTYSIYIYDRWGAEMYESTDPKLYWNGRIKVTNNLAPDGTYYYVIKATCNNTSYVKKGFVQLIGEK